MNFTISEFTRENLIPAHVADKILQFHIPNLESCRSAIEIPIIISQRSGYRSILTEQANGRSGNSQHTFKGKGAVDVTCADMVLLGGALKDLTDYTRICYYPTKHFYHCDFRPSTHRIYVSHDGVNWSRERNF